MSAFTTLQYVVAFSVSLNILPAAGAHMGDEDVQKTAQQYISEFQRGVDYDAKNPITSFVRNRNLDRSNLYILTKELAVGTPQVRENIVRLLEQIGLQLDSPSSDKFPIIRDHAIIKALHVEAFAKDDVAADVAATILREKCKGSDLAAFSKVYLDSLQRRNRDYLYLVAKAKVTSARPYVDALAQSQDGKAREQSLKVINIVRAALGNTELEDEFIEATYNAEKNAPAAPPNRFYDVGSAKDGKEVAAGLAKLGLIGTQRSLVTVCGYLRSTMKTYSTNQGERTIRYDALDALRYNFPDERVLYRPVTLNEWAAAEAFCTRNIGAVFDGPTPDLDSDRIVPTGMLPRPSSRPKK
jgi:hypothetical protein